MVLIKSVPPFIDWEMLDYDIPLLVSYFQYGHLGTNLRIIFNLIFVKFAKKIRRLITDPKYILGSVV